MSKSRDFSDQLRDAVMHAGESRYKISKATGIPQGNLSNFVHGKSGLTMANIDKLCQHLGLGLTKQNRKDK